MIISQKWEDTVVLMGHDDTDPSAEPEHRWHMVPGTGTRFKVGSELPSYKKAW
jgi:hypothetical protein